MSSPYDGLARVVHVSDEYTVVINRGLDSGIEIGDHYLVFGLGPEIKDPTTEESLGQLEVVRGRAAVIHVQEKMSTLRTVESRAIPGSKRIVKRQGGQNAITMALLGSGTTIEEIEENPETIDEPLDAAIGDLVKPI